MIFREKIKDHWRGTLSLSQHHELTDQGTGDTCTNNESSACNCIRSPENSTQQYSCPDTSHKKVFARCCNLEKKTKKTFGNNKSLLQFKIKYEHSCRCVSEDEKLAKIVSAVNSNDYVDQITSMVKNVFTSVNVQYVCIVVCI